MLSLVILLSINVTYGQQQDNNTQILLEDVQDPTESPVCIFCPEPLPTPETDEPCSELPCNEGDDESPTPHFPGICLLGACNVADYDNQTNTLSIKNIAIKSKEAGVTMYSMPDLNESIMIVDIIGLNTGSVNSFNINAVENSINLNLGHLNLPLGIYVVRLRNNKEIFISKKLAIQ